ncbi:Protein N-terminal and lysine N-methyltransferase efm7 [Tilletia horrida]|uniref:Protein N-terminal and lysine N-methyltransferase efm7 n=1 Tax=Tilletia horrida TaxID=155126 RepID=A0AAN6JWJ8_9BASI|nr:Protein N-terminal and lysine N-methyltransferase efm7 [Tilletia horrida]KAK0567836.1 Protein N-terminal and lysine N-methyltransferase efm7 [Tilletia horrida]
MSFYDQQQPSKSGGIAGLLRNASRKSTDSLRSAKSLATRSLRKNNPSMTSLHAGEAPPPVPPHDESYYRSRSRLTDHSSHYESAPDQHSAQQSPYINSTNPSRSNLDPGGQSPYGQNHHANGGGSGNITRHGSRTTLNNIDEDGYPSHSSATSAGLSSGPASRSRASLLSTFSNPAPKSSSYGSRTSAPTSNKSSLTRSASKYSIRSEGRPPNGYSQGPYGDTAAGRYGDGNTIAQLYAVFGLPKDPAVWTLAEEDCVSGVQHLDGAVGKYWRPEVLGCSICPSPAEVIADMVAERKRSGSTITGADRDGAVTPTRDDASNSASVGRKGKKGKKAVKDSSNKWDGRGADGKKPQNPKFIEMADGRGGVEKAETARVLSKALKLCFTREIEIVAGQAPYPPASTSHSFSFTVPTIRGSAAPPPPSSAAYGDATTRSGVALHKKGAASGVGEGYGAQGNGEDGNGSDLATFYGVVLTVWSAADDRRARAVKRELTRAAKAAKLKKRRDQTNGRGAAGAGGNGSGANGGLDGAEEEDILGGSFLPENNTFFMPYAICIVSRYPIYNLLGDWNKAAWHKYSRNIEMHNRLMSHILRQPAPRLGETFRIESPDDDVSFVCTFPGALEWGRGLIGVDFTMWPLFKTLSIDHILTICEVALTPTGKVLFHSRHPALLGLAVETIKYLIELRGWHGVAHQNCHARDVKIYLEDPGSWLIGINTELKSIIRPARDVCVVDLDINMLNCVAPPQGAPTTKGIREKRKRKLVTALGFATADYGPPREYVEAYPAGRFRPMSVLVPRLDRSPYERLMPPSWWDQGAVLSAFDKVLHDGARSILQRMMPRSSSSRVRVASEAELAAILALRRRASTFVDARDGLENKIGKLNKRLAFLMSESDLWRAQFEKIQQLVDRLTKEANDLRTKVDKERRESRRLSSSIAQKDMEQVQLRLQLQETELARDNARQELDKMQQALDSLEQEREAMVDEIRAVIAAGTSAGDDAVSVAYSRFELNSELGASRASSPNGSQMTHASMTPSQSAEMILKARAAAEQRINGGREGRSRSSLRGGPGSTSARRSLSQDRGEREGKRGNQSTMSSVQNHFPDDQMNYEIRQRTSVVTDHISRLQSQLEATLQNLESRRERDRDRGRRTSVSSQNSHRYEYSTPSALSHGYRDAPSSVGHGGMSTVSHLYSPSARGGKEGSQSYESVENLQQRNGATASPSASGDVSDSGTNARRRDVAQGPPPPSSYRLPPNRHNREGSGSSSNASSAGVAPQPVKTAGERQYSNPWKEAAALGSNGSKIAVTSPSPTMADPPKSDTVASPTGATSPPSADATGVSSSSSTPHLDEEADRGTPNKGTSKSVPSSISLVAAGNDSANATTDTDDSK